MAPGKIDCCIVDGGRLIRLLPITNLKENTFLAWAERLREFVEGLPGNTVRIISIIMVIQMIILLHQKEDNRKVESEKSTILVRTYRVLKTGTNFRQLINLIVDHLLCAIGKAAFVTKGEFCYRTFGSNGSEITFDECIEIPELRSLHTEADPRIALHAVYASRCHESVCAVADDANILILLLHVAEKCTSWSYLRQGTH